MSNQNPQTMDEWRRYIDNLDRTKVHDKAMAANTMGFIEILKEEGYKSGEIEQILVWFGMRLHDEGKFVPGSGGTQYLNYRTLLEDHGVDVE